MNSQELEQTARGLETSQEVLKAILSIASDERPYLNIWENPTKAELSTVREIVYRENPDHEGLFYWGEETL